MSTNLMYVLSPGNLARPDFAHEHCNVTHESLSYVSYQPRSVKQVEISPNEAIPMSFSRKGTWRCARKSARSAPGTSIIASRGMTAADQRDYKAANLFA